MKPKYCNKRKADASPEEWAAHLEYRRIFCYSKYRDREKIRQKEYNARPEVKERRRIRASSTEAVSQRIAYRESKEGKAQRADYFQKVRNDPAKYAKRLEDQRKRRTGFTKDMVDQLLIAQGNKCAICQRSFEDRQVRADHCHTTNTPRGLLCHHCNIIEGMLKGMQMTAEEFAYRMTDYLTHPPISLIEP